MVRNDKRWKEILQLFLEYIDIYHKFPLYNEEYKNVRLDRWLRHQQDAYRGGFLPEERKLLLDEWIPEWNSNLKRQDLNAKYLLKDNWKHEVTGVPIDAFLKGKELLSALHDGIYNCDKWLEKNHNFLSFAGGLKVFTCYQKLYPHLHPNYSYLLAAVFLTEEELHDINIVKNFLENLPFKTADEMCNQINDILKPYPICLQCIQMRYGLVTNQAMTLETIADHFGFTKSKVQNAIKKAKRQLQKSNILKDISEESTEMNRIIEEENTIKILKLSTRANNCLLRSHINTIMELEKLNDSDLLAIKNMGVKTANEIREKLKAYKRTAP